MFPHAIVFYVHKKSDFFLEMKHCAAENNLQTCDLFYGYTLLTKIIIKHILCIFLTYL